MKPRYHFGHLFFSVSVALMLAILPLPHSIWWLRPQFLALFLIFWSLYSGARSVLWMSWCVGLLLDLITASPLGLNALGLMLMIYVLQKIKPFMQHYRRWQHGLLITLLCLFYVAILSWFVGYLTQAYVFGPLAFSAISSGILWYLIFPMLPSSKHNQQAIPIYLER